MTRPSDDSSQTWHVHPDDTWAWGIDCDACRKEQRGREGASTLPRFNIRHLQRQNKEGTTTASEVRDVLAGVKSEDRDKIARRR